MSLTTPLSTAHAARLPSKAKAEKVITRYFNGYPKKYKTTEITGKVSQVEIESIDELQKNLVSIAATVHFDNGSTLPIRISLLRKYPLGWRQSGWEVLHN